MSGLSGAAVVPAERLLVGCDFSSSPSRKKPIVLALGRLLGKHIVLSKIERFTALDVLGDWLLDSPGRLADSGLPAAPRHWLGVFDLPFGLPRELVLALGWPVDWLACVQHFCALDRDDIRAQFRAFCAARPAGGKFAHRATDRPAGSSPSMKWVNPPVAFMLHAGVPQLLRSGAELPGLYAGSAANRDAQGLSRRVALEGYPGLLAREVLGRTSYKSDDRAAQTPQRLIARKDLITALETGQTRLDLFLRLSHAQRDALVDDASGDSLDAVLCLVQAAWAERRWRAGDARFGLAPDMDPLEGWIVTA